MLFRIKWPGSRKSFWTILIFFIFNLKNCKNNRWIHRCGRFVEPNQLVMVPKFTSNPPMVFWCFGRGKTKSFHTLFWHWLPVNWPADDAILLVIRPFWTHDWLQNGDGCFECTCWVIGPIIPRSYSVVMREPDSNIGNAAQSQQANPAYGLSPWMISDLERSAGVYIDMLNDRLSLIFWWVLPGNTGYSFAYHQDHASQHGVWYSNFIPFVKYRSVQLPNEKSHFLILF